MRTINILMLMLVAFGVHAQTSPVDKVFDTYAEKEGFSSVYISKAMFSLFANPDSKDDFAQVVSGLEAIKILSVDDSVLNRKLNLYQEVAKNLPLKEYEQLMIIRTKDQETRMMVLKQGGKIREFLMIGGGDDNFIISITGNIDLKAIARLSRAMNIKELENVDKLK